MNLILLDPRDISGDAAIRLDDERARHMRVVLGVGPGDTVRVGQLDGPTGLGHVVAVDADSVTLSCTWDASCPPRPRIDLILALPRPKVLRRLWAQLAALGVGRIILTNAARVERHYFDTHVLAPECYRPLLIEGLQQARDTWVPQVSVHRQFRKLIEDELDVLCGNGLRLVASPDARRRGHMWPVEAPSSRVLLAIGPEGGWNAFELALLAARGFQSVSLGPRTLRTDTACIALLALVDQALRAPALNICNETIVEL